MARIELLIKCAQCTNHAFGHVPITVDVAANGTNTLGLLVKPCKACIDRQVEDIVHLRLQAIAKAIQEDK